MSYDVLIIGGGVVGLTAALAMAERNFMAAVIDAGPLKVKPSSAESRVYALNHASQHLLQQLGVWQHIKQHGVSPYRRMYVWDAVQGAHIDFDSRSIGTQDLGVIIEESVLKQALLEQIAQQTNIHLFPESCVEEVLSEEECIRVSNQQQTWEGQLLMVADGAHSKARKQLQVSLTDWSYDQLALVATVAVEKAHQQTAYQVFHPDGPLAFLPLSNPHECSIVWSMDSKLAKKLRDHSDEALNELLTQAFEHKLGQVKIISPSHQFPLHMRHVKQYAGSRWMLLGDAAHTIHPLAGLGLNVGLADITSWLRCLDRAQNRLLSKKALGSYQRDRKSAVWQIILLMEGFKRLFGTSVTPIVHLRGLGLSLCNQFIFIKKLVIQHARGY